MSAALFAAIASSSLVAPVAGALGDRYDRRRVMIVSELTAAAFAAAMVGRARSMAAGDPGRPGGAGRGARSCRRPSAAVPNLVVDDRLEWANSTLAVGRNVGQLLGPLVGGVAAAAVGSAAVFGNLRGRVPDLGRAGGVRCRAGSRASAPSTTTASCGPGSYSSGTHRCCAAMTVAWMVLLFPARPGARGRAAAGARVRPGRGRPTA
jgi:hypothetical protein